MAQGGWRGISKGPGNAPESGLEEQNLGCRVSRWEVGAVFKPTKVKEPSRDGESSRGCSKFRHLVPMRSFPAEGRDGDQL